MSQWRYGMRLSIALIVAIAMGTSGEAIAGPHSVGPGSDDVVAMWSSQALTTSPATTTAFYPVGLDTTIVLDVLLEGAAAGATVTVTPVFQIPGGNACGYPTEHLSTPQATTWTQGSRADFLLTITPPPGCDRMYMTGITSDSDGCTVTARAIGR